MGNLKIPTRKISNEEVTAGVKLTNQRDLDDRSATFEEYVLDSIARVQELKPNQQIRVGKKLALEDVGLVVTVNGQTGVMTDLRLRDPDSHAPEATTAVVNGRFFKIGRGELYILTYPES